MYLFVFEFLGTSELMVILVVALIVFGPRKLPQLSRSLGKSLSEFRRASDDFKRTWEREVALEDFTDKPKDADSIPAPPLVRPTDNSIGRGQSYAQPAAELDQFSGNVEPAANTEPNPRPEPQTIEAPVASKREWL